MTAAVGQSCAAGGTYLSGEHARPSTRFEHVIFWRPERQLTSFVVIAVAALFIAVGAAILLSVLIFA
ncbi:MAG: hypothetical protein JO105_16645 [Hyphomicrobiales bacterium]|nr:hypothetical protein [Hyphomicrobiales bacterium]